MTKTRRQLMAGVMMAGLVGAGRPAGAADATAPEMARVRSTNPSITALIQQATERSETFRGIVATINASDGIVYVEEGQCGHGVRACLVAVMTAGTNRMLRVKVDTRKADWDLMGSIGHELRHGIEVLSEPGVRSNADMYFLYARIGFRGTGNGAVETNAAIDAGTAVRAEVRKSQARGEGN